MKTFLKLSLFLVALLSIDAAPVNGNGTMTVVPYSSDADIAAFYFKGCIPGTTKITPLEGGATEYTCTRETGRRNGSAKHEFGTHLWVRSDGGTISVDFGLGAASVSGDNQLFRFAGYMNSDWGTVRSVVYRDRETPEEVDNLGQACSGDGVFCFDVYDGTCAFSFAHKTWEKGCPLLKVIKFSVDA